MSPTLRITCPKCQAALVVPAHQVGGVTTCDDCLEEFVVPAAATSPPGSTSGDHDADVPTAEELDDPALRKLLRPDFTGDSPPEPKPGDDVIRLDDDDLEPAPQKKPLLTSDYEFGLNCHICGTRIDVTDRDVGRRVKCPDCHSLIAVREPHPSKRRPPAARQPAESSASQSVAEDDEFRLAGGAGDAALPTAYQSMASDLLRKAEAEAARQTPQARSFTPQDALRDTLQKAKDELDEAAERTRPPLPDAPFRDRIASYLFDPSTIGRLAVLGAALFVELGAIQMAIEYTHGGGLQQFVSVLLRMFAVTFGFLLGTTMSVSLQGILQDTSNGLDVIESWPDLNFLDWIGDAFYVFNSLFVAVAPAFALGQVVGWAGAPTGVYWTVVLVGVAAGLILVFPLLLLSMMEAGSAFVPVSAPVFRSVGLSPGRWLTFSLLGMLLVGAGLALLVVRFAWSPPMLVNLLLAFLVVLLASFYFRLLGRLAWCGEEAVAQADERREEALEQQSAASPGPPPE